MFVIKTYKQFIVGHKLLNGIIVVMNDGIFSRFYVFKDKQPIVSEYFTVKDIDDFLLPPSRITSCIFGHVLFEKLFGEIVVIL